VLQFNRFIAPCRQLFKGLTSLPAALLVSGGFLIGGGTLPATSPVLASAPERPTAPLAVSADSSHRLADGIYLYGESSEPDRVGKAYMVFEVQNDRAIGAFYMPSSSFDCFYGNIEPNRLAVTVVNSYENTTYAYALPMEQYPIASNQPTGDLEFQGFHRIAEVSDNDRRILEMCKENYQDRAWN
jgi:hypothetical protein